MNEGKFLIKVLPADGCNPEFAPNEEEQHGMECKGYLLVTFDKDGDPEHEVMNGISTANIADFLRDGSAKGVAPEIRMAAAIADGWIRAREIMRESKVKEKTNDFLDFLKGKLLEEEL